MIREDGGYTLVELLTVMVILTTVLGGVTTLFVAGWKSQKDVNLRVEAQLNARRALDKVRREAHCATAVSGTATAVTLTLPSKCAGTTTAGEVTWCTAASGATYALYRKPGSTCDAAGVKWIEYLTVGEVFALTEQSSTTLARLHVDFSVDPDVTDKRQPYRLTDGLALRNSSRSDP